LGAVAGCAPVAAVVGAAGGRCATAGPSLSRDIVDDGDAPPRLENVNNRYPTSCKTGQSVCAGWPDTFGLTIFFVRTNARAPRTGRSRTHGRSGAPAHTGTADMRIASIDGTTCPSMGQRAHRRDDVRIDGNACVSGLCTRFACHLASAGESRRQIVAPARRTRRWARQTSRFAHVPTAPLLIGSTTFG